VSIGAGIDPVVDPTLGSMRVDRVHVVGADATTIDANGSEVVFLHCTDSFTLERLTLSGATSPADPDSTSGFVDVTDCEAGPPSGTIELRDVTATANGTPAVSGDAGETAVDLVVAGSDISGNEADGISGSFRTMTVTSSRLADNAGAAIRAASGVQVDDSTIEGNGDGGIVNDDAGIQVRRSSIVGNTGSGLSAGDEAIWVEQSLIAGNTGFAVSTQESGATVLDSTLSGNGGGVSVSFDPTVVIRRSTLVDNGVALHGGEGVVRISGSVIQGGVGCSGTALTVTSEGWNVASDTTCGLTATGDQQGVDALLGPLADNGGPTLTHLPAAGSAARDAIPLGTADLCTGPLVDQRGTARPQGPACDRGAVEQ
jgi:hypothetical protein